MVSTIDIMSVRSRNGGVSQLKVSTFLSVKNASVFSASTFFTEKNV